MRRVNVIIRSDSRTIKKNKINSVIRSHINYLKRNPSIYEVYSSGLKEGQFLQLLNEKQPFRFIISPAEKCNMQDLVEETINTIKKYNNIRKLDYIAYAHYDTAHPHAHVMIIPPKYKTNFKASVSFMQNIVLPDINKYLEKIYEKKEESQLRLEYIEGINNQGQTKADYDIRRLCELNKTYSPATYVYNALNENKLEAWKIPYIHRRIQTFLNEGIAYRNQTGAIIFPYDFIYRKIIRGKLYQHLNNLPKDIDLNLITMRKTNQDNISKVLSEITNNEKKTISMVILTKNGEIELNEKKIRKNKNIQMVK